MIDAAAALQLPSAQLSKQDLEDCRVMLTKLHEHTTKYMTINGPAPLTVPYGEMSLPASKMLAHALKPLGWNANFNLIAENPRFQGGQPVPHHWIIQILPTPETYDAILAETIRALAVPQLDA